MIDWTRGFAAQIRRDLEFAKVMVEALWQQHRSLRRSTRRRNGR